MTYNNPTPHYSKPIITVKGYGDFQILCADGSSYDISVSNVYPEVTINSELNDCYYDGNNANQYVTFNDNPNNKFPLLSPGNNRFLWTDNTIEKIIIQTRWFVI